MLAYIHQTCGKPAFMMTAPPLPLAKASSKDVLHLNYQPMQYGADKVCEECGATLSGFLRAENLRVMI